MTKSQQTLCVLFFKKKIEEIEGKIPFIDISPTSKLKENLKDKNMSFSLKTVTESQVVKAIKSLKNKSSSGVDFISPKMIKLSVDVIKVPLTAVINSSISQGEFPDCWKWAYVVFKCFLILGPNRYFGSELTLCQRNDIMSTKSCLQVRNRLNSDPKSQISLT